MERQLVEGTSLSSTISNKLGGLKISEVLISKIIELYIKEKQSLLEKGDIVIEDNVATRYQIRYYNTDKDSEKRSFTVKVQNSLDRNYKSDIIKFVSDNKEVLNIYLDNNQDRFNTLFRVYKEKKGN